MLDLQGNLALFGSWSTDGSQPGATFSYSDGTAGTNAIYSNTLTRPGSAWTWLRSAGPGPTAMELDPSDRIILTGTQSSSPGSIVIDPTAGDAEPSSGRRPG